MSNYTELLGSTLFFSASQQQHCAPIQLLGFPHLSCNLSKHDLLRSVGKDHSKTRMALGSSWSCMWGSHHSHQNSCFWMGDANMIPLGLSWSATVRFHSPPPKKKGECAPCVITGVYLRLGKCVSGKITHGWLICISDLSTLLVGKIWSFLYVPLLPPFY